MCVLGFLYIAVINIFCSKYLQLPTFLWKLPAIRYYDLLLAPNFMYHSKVCEDQKQNKWNNICKLK